MSKCTNPYAAQMVGDCIKHYEEVLELKRELRDQWNENQPEQ